MSKCTFYIHMPPTPRLYKNNGPLANQAVPHVHFHVIPKPDKETGLGVRWNVQKKSMDEIKAIYERIKEKL